MKTTLYGLSALTAAALVLSVLGFFGSLPVMTTKILFMVFTGVQIITMSLLWAMVVQEKKSRSRLKNKLTFHEPSGLTNRKETMKSLSAGVTLARRHHYPYGILLIGLDKFSEINNQLGQRGGDVVLKQVAEYLNSNIRLEDIIGHFEGDIFLIGTPHTELKGTMILANRIRQKILEQVFKAKGGVARMSISIGVACVPPDMYDHDNLILHAVERLKSAKEKGGNCCAGPETTSS